MIPILVTLNNIFKNRLVYRRYPRSLGQILNWKPALKAFHFTKKYPTTRRALKTKRFRKLSEKESIHEPPCCKILDL